MMKNGLLLSAVTLLMACGPQNSLRQSVDAQNLADSTAKMEDLAPAEGTFSGLVHLKQSGQEFAMILQLRRVTDNVHPSQGQDPTSTIELPRLSGNLHFPALDKIVAHPEDLTQLSSFSELTAPMDTHISVLITNGNLVAKTGHLTLPYSLPNSTIGNVGSLDGTLTQGRYTGTWFSELVGVVGTFDLTLGATP
ncbi:MAG: hypothetical protein ACXWPM_08865 [Bdellovibrionota bacterium]